MPLYYKFELIAQISQDLFVFEKEDCKIMISIHYFRLCNRLRCFALRSKIFTYDSFFLIKIHLYCFSLLHFSYYLINSFQSLCFVRIYKNSFFLNTIINKSFHKERCSCKLRGVKWLTYLAVTSSILFTEPPTCMQYILQ